MADITISITIPDANVAEVSEALGVSTKAEFEGWVKTGRRCRIREGRLSKTSQSYRGRRS